MAPSVSVVTRIICSSSGKEKLPEYGAAEAFSPEGAEIPVAVLRDSLDAGLVGCGRLEDGINFAHALDFGVSSSVI
jgi:hypothetical protein